MKQSTYSSLFVSLSLATSLLAMGSSALAQGTPPTGRPAAPRSAPQVATPKIVVIDINRIYKEHARFKQQMEQLKADMDQAEATLRERSQSLQKLSEQLKDFNADSPDYRDREEKLARDSAQLNAEFNLKKKDFFQREAKIYWEVYQEIQAEVGSFTRQYGIDLVLKFSSEEVDTSDRQAVINSINRMIVFENNLDITDQILNRVNAKAGGAGATPVTRAPGNTAAPRR